MANVVGIIQARVGSKRLPAKVIKKLGGKTILEILLDRVSKSKTMDKIIVATTTKEEDDVIERICTEKGHDVFRGSEEDVLDRYYNAAKSCNSRIIVRITADNPLTEVSLIESELKLLTEGNYDYVTTKNIILGLGSEVFTFKAIENAWKNADKKYQREHVTPYIYENPQKFKLGYINPPKFLMRRDIRLTIDTIEDFRLYQELHRHFGDLTEIKIEEIIKFLDSRPEIKKINQKIKQRNYTEVEE